MNALPFLDTDEVAEIVHMKPATLRYWRHVGKGPKFFKMGEHKVMYRQEDVEAWVMEQAGTLHQSTHSVA
jgi:predicted DNA-binding transcriptional regulator AlpA